MNHYAAAESQHPQQREESLLAKLPSFVARAKKHSAIYRERFKDADAQAITTREMLAQLPATAKADLIAEQESAPPFGGYDCFAANENAPRRLYMSPGPIAECDFPGDDYWRTAAPFYALGLRAGMTAHNAFAYHFTPAGAMCECGALALGCRVFPAGPGNSEQQARAMARFKPQAYTGTPDFLRAIMERADEAGLDVSSLKMASVSGGYLPPQLRAFYESRGVKTLQWYGSAEFGAIAFESIADAPMIVSEGLLVEVADPVTRKPCAPGGKGEVLVTNFNDGYPLIRFATGDLSAIVEGESECGRTNMRLAGWLGRCDPAVKIRGVFVHPVQVERLAARFNLAAAQLQVSKGEGGRDEMTLLAQAKANEDAPLDNLRAALREETGLRGEAKAAAEVKGGLINDIRGDKQ